MMAWTTRISVRDWAPPVRMILSTSSRPPSQAPGKLPPPSSGLAMSLFSSMFTVVLQHQGVDPKAAGMAMSFVGITNMITQAVIVGPAIKGLGESGTLYYSCWSLLGGFFMLAMAKGTTVTIASLVPQCVGGVLISAVGTAKLTKAVPKVWM